MFLCVGAVSLLHSRRRRRKEKVQHQQVTQIFSTQRRPICNNFLPNQDGPLQSIYVPQFNSYKIAPAFTYSTYSVLYIKYVDFFFCFRGRFSSLPCNFCTLFTMVLQHIRIIVGDAGFDPGTSALEVWRASNEPPQIYLSG